MSHRGARDKTTPQRRRTMLLVDSTSEAGGPKIECFRVSKTSFKPAQRTAIDHVVGNLQLIAFARSGNTEVAAKRVVTIVKLGDAGCGARGVTHITSSTLANDLPSAIEVMVDRPEIGSGITRVLDPFDTEAIPAPRTKLRSTSC